MVPASKSGRAYEAASRALPQLSAEAQALFLPGILYPFTVLMGLWASGQLAFAGPFSDVAAVVSDSAVSPVFTAAGPQINDWIAAAYGAGSDEALDMAGASFVAMVGAAGLDALRGLIGSPAFAQFVSLVQKDPARFGQGPAPPAVLPEAAIDRVFEAARRSRSQFGPEVQAQLSALFDPATLYTLAAVVLLWLGFQLTPAGPLADLALIAYGGYGLIKDLLVAKDDLQAWVSGAIDAKTDDDLTEAGGHFARAITIIGIDTILTVIGAEAFKRLRVRIKGEPGEFGRVPEVPETPESPRRSPAPERPAEPAPPRRPPSPLRYVVDKAPVFAGAVAAGAVKESSDIGQQVKQASDRTWLIVAAVAGVVVGGTAIAIVHAEGKRR